LKQETSVKFSKEIPTANSRPTSIHSQRGESFILGQGNVQIGVDNTRITEDDHDMMLRLSRTLPNTPNAEIRQKKTYSEADKDVSYKAPVTEFKAAFFDTDSSLKNTLKEEIRPKSALKPAKTPMSELKAAFFENYKTVTEDEKDVKKVTIADIKEQEIYGNMHLMLYRAGVPNHRPHIPIQEQKEKLEKMIIKAEKDQKLFEQQKEEPPKKEPGSHIYAWDPHNQSLKTKQKIDILLSKNSIPSIPVKHVSLVPEEDSSIKPLINNYIFNKMFNNSRGSLSSKQSLNGRAKLPSIFKPKKNL
jgi:hypothetical protein